MKKLYFSFIALSFLIFWGSVCHAQSPLITTVAGDGTGAYSGDGLQATAAELHNSTAVAADKLGNLFIADFANSRVRKVSSSGVISTVAGTGSLGFGSDGVAATATTLYNPQEVIVDAAGNLFIADYNNQRVRMVNAAGIISTVAGTGSVGYSGDGLAATLATFNGPTAIAFDAAGNLLVSDEFNQVIRKVSPAIGGIITTVAGNHTAGFSGDGLAATVAELRQPVGISADAAGNMYISDQLNNRIRKVDASGIITTIAGDGSIGYSGDGFAATLAKLYYPARTVVDAAGNVLIADSYNNVIRKVNPSGIISTFAGTGTPAFGGDMGPATAANLNEPTGVSLDANGNILIADYTNNRIRKVVVFPKAAYSSPGTVCEDSCIALYNTGTGSVDSLRWDIPGVTIASPTNDTLKACFPTPGTYNVSLYVHNISGSDTLTTTFVVTNPPHPHISGTLLFSVPNVYSSYQWYEAEAPTLIPGATSHSFSAGMGKWYVLVDSAGCPGVSDSVIVWESVPTINHPDNKFWLSQSSSSSLTLHALLPLDDNLAIVIYDATGRQVLNDTWGAGGNIKHLTDIAVPPGLYIIKLYNHGTYGVLKWMRQ